MQLFADSGNTDIEGVDTVNACYGGTNAFFNAINWIESSSWDGRDAIVVAGDIAVYEKGPARPTGGAGVVAMLIGPNAPLVIEPGRRGSYMQHAYDFYKPNMSSEYPVVDGHYSIECYFRALDGCYKTYTSRSQKITERAATANGHGHNGAHKEGSNGSSKHDASSHFKGQTSGATEFDNFDYMCFHTPNCKIAQKSYARLLYNDYLQNPHDSRFKDIPESILAIDHGESFGDKTIEKAFMAISANLYKERSLPSTLGASMCGNMYTASLYGALASLIQTVPQNELQGKRIAMFSYGSGLASTLFSLRVVGDLGPIRTAVNLQERLKARHHKSPSFYEKVRFCFFLPPKSSRIGELGFANCST
jgi:hydroxymethylglutaryl-CoA synthase